MLTVTYVIHFLSVIEIDMGGLKFTIKVQNMDFLR